MTEFDFKYCECTECCDQEEGRRCQFDCEICEGCIEAKEEQKEVEFETKQALGVY